MVLPYDAVQFPYENRVKISGRVPFSYENIPKPYDPVLVPYENKGENRGPPGFKPERVPRRMTRAIGAKPGRINAFQLHWPIFRV